MTAKTRFAKGVIGRDLEGNENSFPMARWLPTQLPTALLWFAILTLLIFGDVLLSGSTSVLGALGSDLPQQFLGWRKFGFDELCKGNLALWNPHIFGGAPYFGGFQAALLYPPNALFCALPLPAAVNWSIALHVFFMGSFTCMWARGRGLRMEAAFFAGVLMMFGGTYFLHIRAGHLPNLCAMVWAPLIFLAIDRAFLLTAEKTASSLQVSSCLMLGSFALAMQVFAGHPQYVFTTGLAASLYVGLRLIVTHRRWPVVAVLLLFVLIGLSLSAVQWMAGLQANAETIRSAPVPYEFAKMFGFPPENVLTLLAPGLFGDMSAKFPYWGRCYLWEMSLFMGITGIVAVAYGIYSSDRKTCMPLLIAIVILALLALGSHTPVFELLYQYVPGFNKFRGMSKFTFPISLFLVILAAHGFDRMTRVSLIESSVIRALYGLGTFLLAAALLAGVVNWRVILLAINATNESYFPAALIDNPDAIANVGNGAASSLFFAAMVTGLLALLMRRIGQVSYAPHLLLVLAIAEMLLFAGGTREKFDPKAASFEYIAEFSAKHPGDYRILNTLMPNSALTVNARDLWGADPGVERRYAEFMAFTQDTNPDGVTQNITFARPNPLYAMLRLRYVFLRNEQDVQVVEMTSPMSQFQLLSRYRVISGRDALFEAMKALDFDPRLEVLLETVPNPMPSGDAGIGAAVRTLAFSTDWIEIEIDTPQATILLMTDSYGAAWRATSLNGSVQRDYQLQPANYILRAIPLVAGHHHLRIEYVPGAFEVGKWISLIFSLIFFVTGLVLLYAFRGCRATLT